MKDKQRRMDIPCRFHFQFPKVEARGVNPSPSTYSSLQDGITPRPRKLQFVHSGADNQENGKFTFSFSKKTFFLDARRGGILPLVLIVRINSYDQENTCSLLTLVSYSDLCSRSSTDCTYYSKSQNKRYVPVWLRSVNKQ